MTHVEFILQDQFEELAVVQMRARPGDAGGFWEGSLGDAGERPAPENPFVPLCVEPLQQGRSYVHSEFERGPSVGINATIGMAATPLAVSKRCFCRVGARQVLPAPVFSDDGADAVQRRTVVRQFKYLHCGEEFHCIRRRVAQGFQQARANQNWDVVFATVQEHSSL